VAAVLQHNGVEFKYFTVFGQVSVILKRVLSVCYCFIDQLTENNVAWKTIQLDHVMDRQA
jgi:hypothetical protein